MADLSDAGRILSGAYKGAKWGLRTRTQRKWFKFLLTQSVLLTLLVERPEVQDQRIRESADKIVGILKRTPVPMEQPEGVFSRIGRFFRRVVTRGVRYPEYRGPRRDSFQERLFLWAKAAAESEPGKLALDYAQFPGGEHQAEVFALRFQAATEALLKDGTRPPSDAMNHARFVMLCDIDIGLTEAQLQERVHNRNAALRSLAAGAVGATFSGIGLNNDWLETIGFAVVGSGSSLALDYGIAVGRRTTQKMIAARRQALAWLVFLAEKLQGSRMEGLPEREVVEDWRAYLLRTLTTLVRPDPEGLKAFLYELSTVERVEKLIQTAERAADEDLSRLLTEVETALEYNDLKDFPNAVRNILFLTQGVSSRSGGYSQPEISAGQPPLQLPRIPDALE